MMIRERAVNFAIGKIMQATDWQEVQDALCNHDEFGPWLRADEDGASVSQSVIRDAEARLGDKIPAAYA